MANFAKTSFYNKLLSIVFVSISSFNLANGHYYLEEKPCGVIYSAPNYGGEQYALKDREQSVNLQQDLHASPSGWNVTGSLKIESGCEMVICNETYFDGSCQTLETGQHPIFANVGLSDAASVKCECPKQCKCSDIFMKQTSCARAYLEGGCKTCHSAYVDLPQGEKDLFPEEFVDKVEALRIRKGCTLTIYPEEKFQGEEEIFDSEINEDYKGQIGSYECECSPDVIVEKPRHPRPPSYPPLVNIPNNLDSLIKLLSQKQYSEHPGLRAAFQSLKNGRSSTNAYILLLGATGAGKSTAINLLFDNPNVTEAGTDRSITNDILEFRIPVPIDEIGVANSELRVIDTPGFGDTKGIGRDSQFMATLDAYLTNHEELHNRIPNVVLIFHKYSDNRFDGEGAQFVRMLRAYDSFREKITDENYSNIVFVLSHFCSETIQNKRRPDKKLARFKKVIQNFSSFPKPTLITVAENKGDEQNLAIVNGYYKLPNNEYYPKNLFDKMDLVTQNGRDVIGQGVFRTAFKDSDDFNITRIKFKLMENGGPKVLYYFRLLSGIILDLKKTEISQILDQVWEGLDANLRRQFKHSLPYLQKALYLRKINTKKDIPTTSTAILKLLTALTHDDATRALLDKGLNIKPPTFPHNTVAGFGYNVFKDSYLPTSPFKLGELQQSEIGFMIPKGLTCKLETAAKESFLVFDNMDKYLEQRLKNLGIDGVISKDNFTGAIKPGHNIRDISFRNDSCSLSATRAFRHFEFQVNERLTVTPQFKSAVEKLSPFNESDHESVPKWTKFFNDFGTHVVRSVYGGGRIEIKLNSNKPCNNDLFQAIFDLIKFAEDLSFMINNETESGNHTTGRKTVLKEGIDHSLTFFGGNRDYHANDLTKMLIDDANELLRNWKKSLKFNPVVLNTEMRLVPISRFVKKIGQNYSSEIDRATELLFNSKLTYNPPKISERPPETRPNIPGLDGIFKLIHESNQKMNDLMMEMKRMEVENEKKRQGMDEKRQQWERERHQEELEYRRKKEQADRLAEEDRRKYMQELEVKRLAHAAKVKAEQLEFQNQLMKAQREAQARTDEILRVIANRPPPRSNCLKSGTKILMADWTQKDVESLMVGDVILDKDLNPTTVLGVSFEFLLDGKFYGFDNQTFFFTDNHIFVGPSNEQNDKMKLYAKSTPSLFGQNPLIEYLNVTEMGSNVILFHLGSADKVVDKAVTVFEDPDSYPEDTRVYDIQVDSPTGTYFANGYVCRHEIPPVEVWPSTMSLLFRLLDSPEFRSLANLEYSLNTLPIFEGIITNIALKVGEFIVKYDGKGQTKQTVNDLMTLDNVNVEAHISKLFSNPTITAFGLRFYAKVGPILAPVLDGISGQVIDEQNVAILQHDIYYLVKSELESYLKN